MLRPQLDVLWGQIDVAAPDSTQITTALTKLTAKLQAQDFLPILIRTYRETSDSLRSSLDEILLAWLQENQYVDELASLIKQAGLPADDQEIAVSWLRSADVDVDQLLADRPNLFYKAYINKEMDDTPEAFLFVYCYTNHRRNRATGFMICTDSDELWSGAVSMAYFTPARSTEEIENEDLINFQQQFEVELVEIDAEEAKQEIYHALHQNIDQDISPPVDFLNERRAFFDIMSHLPDATDATALTFTEADFDKLGKLNKSAEDIMKIEKELAKMIKEKYKEERWGDDDE